ncbi:MAG: YihY/virulence factor BrkB family protein [Candidatus Gastranaerophilales bacterium]|nr:YihY/virulence factor BrkB family protein [Candidatus Gastranaerophilales bacterium]
MGRLLRYFRHITKAVVENDFSGMAAEMGFMLMLGIFPAMLFLMAIFGWMGNKSFMNPILLFMSNILPVNSMELIRTVLKEVMLFSRGGLVATIGIIVTLFLTSNAVAVVLKGLNRAYKVEETRSFLYTRVLSVIMVFVNTLMLFLSINLIIFGKVIINFLIVYAGISHAFVITLLTLRWPVAFFALYLMALINYYILPDLKGDEKLKRKSALPGTLFFCIFWLAGSWGFSVYVNNLHTYNKVYGTIGAFAVLMVWLYYTSLLLLIGGEINSQVYNKLEINSEQ